MISDPKFNTAKDWFEKLRDNLVEIIQNIDENKFEITNCDHKDEGGGKMSKLKGNIIEKGGVNISTVSGKFNKNMQETIPGSKDNPNYSATGISVVLHPVSPKIPSMHFNTRFIKTSQEWFGGGMDITPCIEDKKLKKWFHKEIKLTCDKHNKKYYKKYKKNCDEYFYLPHRKETRGIGGIFFDYKKENWEKDFNFVRDVGLTFKRIFGEIINKKNNKRWNNKQKEIQYLKRGRYVEFNLLYDRGTKFGLQTGGNTDAILMSLPPKAKW